MKQKIFFIFFLLLSFSLCSENVSATSLGHTDARDPHMHCVDGSGDFTPPIDCGVVAPNTNAAEDSFTLGSGGCPNGTASSTSGVCLPVGGDLDLNDDGVLDTLGKVLLFLAGVIASVAILMIVISGILYITSAGDTSRVERAKSTLLFAIIGLVIALLAWVIVVTIQSVFADPSGSDTTECLPSDLDCFTIPIK